MISAATPHPHQLSRLFDRVGYYGSTARRSFHFRLALANLICGLLPGFAGGAMRARLYRLAGLRGIAPSAFLMGNLRLITGTGNISDKLAIGDHSVVGNSVTLNLDADLTIGRNVSLGPNVLVYTGTHMIGPGSNRRVGALLAKPVVIEDGCWIGLAAIVLPGVTLGHGSVVAAGAVVSQSVPPNSYVEGNPARVVRELPWGDR